FFTQVSLVTIGHRAGRSSAFGLAEAELLSASSRPNGLPSRCACCVALTPLSKRHFFEVISCAVKGRTPLRTGREGLPSSGSSPWPLSPVLLVTLPMAPGVYKAFVANVIRTALAFEVDMVRFYGFSRYELVSTQSAPIFLSLEQHQP